MEITRAVDFYCYCNAPSSVGVISPSSYYSSSQVLVGTTLFCAVSCGHESIVNTLVPKVALQIVAEGQIKYLCGLSEINLPKVMRQTTLNRQPNWSLAFGLRLLSAVIGKSN